MGHKYRILFTKKITRRPVTKTVVSINVVLFAVYLLTHSIVMVNYHVISRQHHNNINNNGCRRHVFA